MPHKIVAVDDADMVRHLLAVVLGTDADVTTFESGTAAVESLQSMDGIDAVVLDVMMPGIDGFETCRRIRQMPQHADVAIVMLSAKSSPADIATGREAGADEYLAKPFDPDTLLTTVNELLAISAEQRRAKREGATA